MSGYPAIVDAVANWDASSIGLDISPHLAGTCCIRWGSTGHLKLLLTKDSLDAFLDVEYVAWHLEQNDDIALRRLESETHHPVFASRTSLIAVIELEDDVHAIEGEHPELVDAVWGLLKRTWEESPAVEHDGTSVGEIRGFFGDHVSEDHAEAYLSILDAVWPLQLTDDALDAIEVAVLVAAHAEKELREISAWGAEVEIGTRADFSRAKSRLVELGVVETTAVDTKVGRPPLRLHLIDPERISSDRIDVNIALDILGSIEQSDDDVEE